MVLIERVAVEMALECDVVVVIAATCLPPNSDLKTSKSCT
jgi:hypothetical protein